MTRRSLRDALDAIRPPRPPDRKRYGWLRLYNDFPTHPKWDVVATMTCVEKSRVVGIAACLLVAANKGRPRGSIGEFSLLECAVALRIPPEEVRRVYKALEEMTWIDQGHLSTWDERQPDKEDPTAADRQKRSRARRKEKLKQDLTASHRDMRDVTPRPDTDKKKEGGVTGLTPGDAVGWAEAEAYRKEQRETQRPLPLPPVVVRGSARR